MTHNLYFDSLNKDKELQISNNGSHPVTDQKKTKYYSNNIEDATIKKRLIEQYNKTDQTSGIYQLNQQTSSTIACSKRQHQNNHLINQLNQSINQYQFSFKKQEPIKNVQYQAFQIHHQTMSSNINQLHNDLENEGDIYNMIKTEKLLISAQQQLYEKPRPKISKIDREITSFYQQNRNVNLEYRKAKFMQIFLGKKYKNNALL